jgi:hypothetical protein
VRLLDADKTNFGGMLILLASTIILTLKHYDHCYLTPLPFLFNTMTVSLSVRVLDADETNLGEMLTP